MPMGDVLFTIRADGKQAVRETNQVTKSVGILQNATDAQKRAFARLENGTTTAAHALRGQGRASDMARKSMTGFTLATDASSIALARADAEINDLTRETWAHTRAVDSAERQLEQMNDATRRYSNQMAKATTRTRQFRSAQGRLATNIRNNRTIMFAAASLLGFGGGGFIGRITQGARETTLMAEALDISTESLFAQRQEYEKVGKTATDFKNVMTNLIIAQGEATSGNIRHIEVFQKMGLTMQQVARFDAEELYNAVKDASDRGILSATDLNVFLRKESIATFRQVKKGHKDLTDSEIQGAADVAKAWDEAMADIEKEAIRAVTESKDSFIELIGIIEQGAVFTIDVVANVGNIPGWLLEQLGGKSPEGVGNTDWLNPATWLAAAMGQDLEPPDNPPTYEGPSSPGADPFSVGGRAADAQRVLAFISRYYSNPDDPAYKPFTDRLWERAYQPILNPTTAETSLSAQPEAQAAFLQAQQDILDFVDEGMNIGKRDGAGGGDGGRVDDSAAREAERMAARSAGAFARAEEDGLRRAFSTAIRSEDFTLAREQAEDLHAFRTTQADLLETAGEQFLARQQADFALQDSLLDISSREQRILDDIKDADMAAAKELIQVRKELEEHNARELAKANEAIGGAQARLITGSQLGPQYTQALNDLRVETDSLRAAAALLPPGQRAGQISAIDTYEQQQIAQLNQQFLSHPLTSPDPTTAGSRGGAGTLQNRSLIINVYNAGSVLAQQDLSDAIFDAIRTGDESGVLLSG